VLDVLQLELHVLEQLQLLLHQPASSCFTSEISSISNVSLSSCANSCLRWLNESLCAMIIATVFTSFPEIPTSDVVGKRVASGRFASKTSVSMSSTAREAS
jgi:hypothetical protein